MLYLQPRAASVKLDATGKGTVTFEIDNTNQRWVIDSAGCTTDQAADVTPIPRFDVYLNGTDNTHWRGGTDNGRRDLATGRVVLYPGDVLYGVWTGGIPGSTATALIDGTFDPAGVPLSD